MIYEYRCRDCGLISDLPVYSPVGANATAPCHDCGGLLRRIVSNFSIHRGDPDTHFNFTTGQVVHNKRDFRDQLKYKNDEMTARTGFESNYQPLDLRDKDACGATDEGLNTTNPKRKIII